MNCAFSHNFMRSLSCWLRSTCFSYASRFCCFFCCFPNWKWKIIKTEKEITKKLTYTQQLFRNRFSDILKQINHFHDTVQLLDCHLLIRFELLSFVFQCFDFKQTDLKLQKRIINDATQERLLPIPKDKMEIETKRVDAYRHHHKPCAFPSSSSF